MRLASQLTGWDIDILTEAEESERRQKEFAERTQRFIEALDVDEMLAQLLASEGFDTIEEIAYVEATEIASIEGLDDETANEIQIRAREFLDRQAAEMDAKRKDLGVADELAEIDGVSLAIMVALGEDGIKTVEDLAGCATDDLVGWNERKDDETIRHDGALSALEVSGAEAEHMIMQARIKAGWIEEEEPVAEDGEGEGEDGEASETAAADAAQ